MGHGDGQGYSAKENPSVPCFAGIWRYRTAWPYMESFRPKDCVHLSFQVQHRERRNPSCTSGVNLSRLCTSASQRQLPETRKLLTTSLPAGATENPRPDQMTFVAATAEAMFREGHSRASSRTEGLIQTGSRRTRKKTRPKKIECGDWRRMFCHAKGTKMLEIIACRAHASAYEDT